MKKYAVKKEDLIGQLEGFPIEVVQAMVNEQVRQGNDADVSVFQRDKRAAKIYGGFNWSESKKGRTFWSEIIHNKIFSTFFEKDTKTLKMQISHD